MRYNGQSRDGLYRFLYLRKYPSGKETQNPCRRRSPIAGTICTSDCTSIYTPDWTSDFTSESTSEGTSEVRYNPSLLWRIYFRLYQMEDLLAFGLMRRPLLSHVVFNVSVASRIEGFVFVFNNYVQTFICGRLWACEPFILFKKLNLQFLIQIFFA